MDIVFFDIEVSTSSNKILDLGAINAQDVPFHNSSQGDFFNFVNDAEFIGGHNILNHDLKYLTHLGLEKKKAIDTLYLSPLMFPKRPSHKLLKDEKILSDALNNPLLDAQKSRDLFYDEVNAFKALDEDLKAIYFNLLKDSVEFKGFFEFLGYAAPTKGILRIFQGGSENKNTAKLIKKRFEGAICDNAEIDRFIEYYPIELAYALSVINLKDKRSIIPAWVLRNYPNVENILFLLRNKPCHKACATSERTTENLYRSRRLQLR